MKNNSRSCRGLTLIETIMALAMGAMILIPILAGFNLAIKNWDDDSVRSELLQHARMAMQRMGAELRYGSGVVNWVVNPNALEFYTRHLIDSDWDPPETIRYELVVLATAPLITGLQRKVDGGPGQLLAGSVGKNKINVGNFSITYYKNNPGGGLTPFSGLETDYEADAVRLALTVDTNNGVDSVSLHSLVKMRDK